MNRKDILMFIALGFGFGYCCGVLSQKRELDKLHDKLIDTNVQWAEHCERSFQNGLSKMRE
jgi:hypothetical protein